jgi:hypothetical protein
MGKGILVPTTIEEQYPLRVDSYELGGIDLTLQLAYVDRLDTYYLDLFDSDGNIIYAGRKILANYQVAIRQRDARLPAGIFWADSEDPDDTPPSFDELGQRVMLAYSDPEDVPPAPPLTDAVSIEVI